MLNFLATIAGKILSDEMPMIKTGIAPYCASWQKNREKNL